MKKKQILSFALALSMLVPTSIMVGASGEAVTASISSGYTIGGWGATKYNSSNDSAGSKAGPTIDDSRSGDSSLCMTFPTTAPTSYMYVQSDYQNVKLENGKTYVFGCYAKGMDSIQGGSIYMRVGWDATFGLFSPGETVNGWTNYQGTITMTKDSSQYAWICADKVYGQNAKVLIDDAYIYDITNPSVNLLDNPGFEAHSNKAVNTAYAKEALTIGNWQDYNELSTVATGFYRVAVSGEGSVYGGNKAAYVYRNGSANNNAYIRCRADETIPAGTYTLTVYIKDTNNDKWSQTYTESATFVGIGDYWGYRKGLNECTKSYAGNGWYKYQVEITTTDDRNFIEYFMGASAKKESYYFDELSLVDENGKNYCSIGGGMEQCYVLGEAEPIKFVAYSASTVNKNQAVITWQNPARTDISAITLTVDGNEVEFTPVTTSVGYNQVVLDNIAHGSVHNCELVITAGGRTYTYSKKLVQNCGDNNYNNIVGNRFLNGWSFLRNETTGNYCNTEISIDKDIKYSGDSSLKVIGGRGSASDNVYGALTQGVTLKKNKAYRFTANTKYIGGDTAGAFKAVHIVDGNWNYIKNYTSGKDKWQTVTYDIPAYDGEADDDETYSSTIAFVFDRALMAGWIDDVEIYEIVRGEPTGENLIKNGDFEYNDEWRVSGHKYNLVFDDELSDEVTQLEQGVIMGRVGIQNYEDEDLDVTVVTALYENGRLIDVSFAEQQDVPVLVNPFSTSFIGSSVKVPAMDAEKEYEMKVMLLDSLTGLRPLAEADSFK